MKFILYQSTLGIGRGLANFIIQLHYSTSLFNLIIQEPQKSYSELLLEVVALRITMVVHFTMHYLEWYV